MERDKEQVEINMILKFVDLSGKSLLEVGCGDGRITSQLAGKAQTITAIDPDSESIRKAENNVKGVDFKIGSGEYIAQAGGSFDLVMFTLSLHHQDQKSALRESHRVLKKDGQLLILEPAIDSEVLQYFNLFNDETDVLDNTMVAIESSDFKLEKKESFYTDWSFQDKEELYDFFFDYHNRKPDNRIIYNIDALLGKKISMRPIILTDKVLILLLRKK
jgi:ubiquinone/menaquinone biosynthesis C-methylase UbiE